MNSTCIMVKVEKFYSPLASPTLRWRMIWGVNINTYRVANNKMVASYRRSGGEVSADGVRDVWDSYRISVEWRVFTLKMEAAVSSENLVSIYQTLKRVISIFFSCQCMYLVMYLFFYLLLNVMFTGLLVLFFIELFIYLYISLLFSFIINSWLPPLSSFLSTKLSSSALGHHNLCLKHFCRCVITERWRRSFRHHKKVTRLFQRKTGANIVMPVISLNTQGHFFRKVGYSGYDVPTKMF
jgi:hypothetical protein